MSVEAYPTGSIAAGDIDAYADYGHVFAGDTIESTGSSEDVALLDLGVGSTF